MTKSDRKRINEGRLRPDEHVEWKGMKIPAEQWNEYVKKLRSEFGTPEERDARIAERERQETIANLGENLMKLNQRDRCEG